MADAALAGDGGAEQDSGRKGNEIGDETCRAAGRQVFGDLQRQGEIDPGPGHRLFEVLRGKHDARIVEHVRGDPGAFDAEGGLSAFVQGGGQPGAGAAADVGDGFSGQALGQRGEERAGRVFGMCAAIAIEISRIERSGHDESRWASADYASRGPRDQ